MDKTTARPAPQAAAPTIRWTILLAVGVGTFMSALDGSVVNTVLPVIRNDFSAEIATVQWVVTVYLLLVSGILLSFGRLGDMKGHKPVYVAGFVVFISGSLLCSLAPSAGALIAARAVQGLGAAMLFANSPAILTKNFPPERRGRVLGISAMMTYLGLTVGPSLGGWLANTLGWRSVFWINLPVGLIALFLSVRFIPRDPPAPEPEPFDVPGALAFLAGLVTLMLALNQGHAWGWTSPAVLGLFAAALLLLALFVRLEQRPHPMLDLTLFRSRLFTAATASAVLNYVCVYSVIFLMPFYLIQGRGLSAAQAGLLFTAQPLLMAITAPISGNLSDRIGSRILSTTGMALLAIGLYLLSRLGPETPLWQVPARLAVVGLALGLFASPNTSALMGAAPRNRQGIASGVMATARNMGMVLGVGLAGAVLTSVIEASGGEGVGLFTAISAGLAVAAVIAAVGVVTSAVRGGTGR